MQWETVIGLEIHVQLATATKIFSGASTRFGGAANSQACAIDLAMPGTLPVLNAQAVDFALMFGLAIDADIPVMSVFERKNYFYPDLPKGYQTTQLEKPVIGAGRVTIETADGGSKEVRIHHAHLEEDAGKSLHEGDFGSQYSGIDLNRAGTPLIEIVTEPDLSNATEAVIFAKKLHALVTSLGICDGRMAEGSLRFDINVSVRPLGSETLGTRTETKNLNSFKFMEEAIVREVARQIDVLEDGGSIVQETRLYNGDTKVARSMRSKEEANDYRYFPCPDLLPVVITEARLQRLRDSLPELPDARVARLIERYAIAAKDAQILANDGALANYFETVNEHCDDPRLAANWTTGDLIGRLNGEGLELIESPISAVQLGILIQRIGDQTISGKMAKQVFDGVWSGAGEVDQIIKERGLKQVSDNGALEQLVADVLAKNPAMIDDYIATEEGRRKKKLGGFMGQIMQASKGQANPKQVNQILLAQLQSLSGSRGD
jgi:aspartyl-tRNA(Asn)/glutamyl-tRNA(Gln) amidotransferase subunit B